MSDERNNDRPVRAITHEWRREDFLAMTEGRLHHPTPYSGEALYFEVTLESGEKVQYRIDMRLVALELYMDHHRDREPKLCFRSTVSRVRQDNEGSRRWRKRHCEVELFADGTGQVVGV